MINKCPRCKYSTRKNILKYGIRTKKQYQLINGKVELVVVKIQKYKCTICNKYYLDQIPFATNDVVAFINSLRNDYKISEISKITNLSTHNINKIIKEL